jgi:hypothetical protein
VSLFVARLLRVLTLLALFAVAVVAYLTFFGSNAETRQFPEVQAGETAVAAALDASPTRRLTVRGYVFDDAGPLRICHGRWKAEPPRCIGPYLELDRVDAGSFELERGEDRFGNAVLWSDDEVVLVGTVLGPRMTVISVLADEG